MSRTLLISDLHLGGRFHRSVLPGAGSLTRLLEAIGQVDRLVLLGDTVELTESRSRQALAIADPVLRAIGAEVGGDRELIYVPGNHDLPLIRPWIRTTGRGLRDATEVPLDCTPGMARVSRLLAPARVQIRYPGVWLSERVWATHGHYLDHHLFPVATWGLARDSRRSVPEDHATPADYERRRASISRGVGWMPRHALTPLAELAQLARMTTMPILIRGLLRPRLAPLNSRLLSLQMRHASLPALARVVHRLGIDADWVIFGHVHRLGPLPDDDLRLWRGPDDTPRIANTGSWVHQPLLVGHSSPPHPYWPGGAVLYESGHEPRAFGLLDGVDRATLRRSRPRPGEADTL